MGELNIAKYFSDKNVIGPVFLKRKDLSPSGMPYQTLCVLLSQGSELRNSANNQRDFGKRNFA